MSAWIETALQNPRLAASCLDALVKSFVVLAFAAAFCLAWRRAAAATRHLIWFSALASLPLLPLLPFVLPSAHRPLWAVSGGLTTGNQITLSIQLDPGGAAAANPPQDTPRETLSTVPPYRESGKTLLTTHLNHNWLTTVFALWVGGLSLTLLYPALGQYQLRKISSKAHRLETLGWNRLLVDASETLRLRRAVWLFQSSENVMPLTWGWLWPKVLMPAEADQWSSERRRIVLLHELAHVKRWDCLTQNIARVVCALYWFNPLAWLAARQMRIERERACDDLVLNGGCRASDYANHLVEIARAFRPMPQVTAIAMARPSGLEQRIVAIVDTSRVRRFRPSAAAAVLIFVAVLIYGVGAWSAETVQNLVTAQGRQQLDQLKSFSRAKLDQAKMLTASSGEKISPEYQRFFDAAIKGDVQTVTNMFESFKKRHPQYERRPGVPMDIRLCTSPWEGALEIGLAYDHFANCDPKFTQTAVDDVFQTIPPGSIYFGGTDPGRGLPTAFSKSHVDADPFYTLTQNALANGDYLDYLQDTYGERRHWLGALAEARRADRELQTWDREFQTALDTEASLMSHLPEHDPKCDAADNATDALRKKRVQRTSEILAQLQARTDASKKEALLNQPPKSIYIATEEEMQNAFKDYTADAKKRLEHDQQFPNEPRQIKPGENVRVDSNGVVQATGQIAVMAINARIAKIIFDKNPDREFYVEESFPLDWMYPHLEPAGPIMNINRDPLAELQDNVIHKDHDYWQRRVGEWLGNWLTPETPVNAVTDFVEKIYVRHDLSGFTGDPKFIHDNYAPKMFSKWRGSIGGLYSWRMGVSPDNGPVPHEYLPKNDADRQRLIAEADFAFKQAFAICPTSPEAVYRYVNFLLDQKRKSDALLIAQAAAHIDPAHFNGLVSNLSRQIGAAGSPNASSTKTISAERLQELQDLLKQKDAEYVQKKSEFEKLKAMDHEALKKALPIAMPDTQLNELMSELDLAERALAELQTKYTPEHPRVRIAQEAVDDLKRKVDARIEGIMLGLEAKVAFSKSYAETIKSDLEKLQGTQRGL